MVTYKWEDIRGDNLPFGGQIAKGVRGFACNIWNKYPDRLAYDRDPLLSPAKFFWNIVCAEEGVNRQPTPPPFQGGQCSGVLYTVDLDANLYIVFQNQFIGRIIRTIQIVGPIAQAGILIDPASGYTIVGAINTTGTVVSGWATTRPLCPPTCIPDAVDLATSTCTVNIRRSDGLPDNCGNLPTQWFPILPAPQPGDETWNVNITEPGSDNDLTIPLGWFDVDFNLPLTFNFEVGDIIVDVGGVTINFDKDNEWNTNEQDNNAVDKDFITNDNDRIRDDIQDTIDDLKDTIEEDKEPPNPNDYDEDKQDDVDQVEETDPEISFVRITMARPPKKGKTILMTNPEDNVYFIGYFAWTYERARHIEYPVRKKQNIYVKPSWATGYAYYSVNGATADISTFKKKLAPETLI
jgi:hypothetical protein